jgi:hypothetical protein
MAYQQSCENVPDIVFVVLGNVASAELGGVLVVSILNTHADMSECLDVVAFG